MVCACAYVCVCVCAHVRACVKETMRGRRNKTIKTVIKQWMGRECKRKGSWERDVTRNKRQEQPGDKLESMMTYM